MQISAHLNRTPVMEYEFDIFCVCVWGFVLILNVK